MEYITKNEKETIALAKSLAKSAKGGDLFALIGDLGSGKTTFTKGFAEGLGVEKTVTSPTFVILKIYSASGSKIKRLVHMDCYRLSGQEDALSLGLDEYLDDEETVLLIEWPERIWPMIEKNARKIIFETISENERKITIC